MGEQFVYTAQMRRQDRKLRKLARQVASPAALDQMLRRDLMIGDDPALLEAVRERIEKLVPRLKRVVQ